MKTRIGSLAGAMFMLCGAGVARAESLDDIKTQIRDRLGKLKSVQAKMKMTQDMNMGGMQYKTLSTGMYEVQNKGERSPFHSEMVSKMETTMPGMEPQTRDGRLTSVSDGEFVWTLHEADNQRMATKTRPTEAMGIFGDTRFLDTLEKEHDLKVMKDDKFDGKSVWVIEARPRKPVPMSPIVRTEHSFQKETGLWVRAVAYDEKDKVISTTEVTDIKLNQAIPAERFVFKAPEGVQVQDMTQVPVERHVPAATRPAGHSGK